MDSKKTKNCSKSLKVTFPKMSPEDVVRDYMASKSFGRMDKLRPEFDVVRQDDPQCVVGSLEIHLHQTERLLRQKRRSQAKARQNLNKQWMELAQKEKTLRENFFHFNSFVRENMEKRDRASHKILEDMELSEQRSKEGETLRKNYKEIEKAKIEMDAKIKEYHLYEVFLDEVVENSGEFHNIQDLINRYLSLVTARNQLTHFQEENLVALENARSNIMKIMENNNLIVMGLSNHMNGLQVRFEHASIRCLEGEQLVTRIKNNAVKIINELDEVKSSIWNIYVHMAHAKNHLVKIKKENVEEQALYIKRTLTELSKINNILRKPAKLAKTKSKAT